MTQIHPDTRPDATGDDGQPQPPVTPAPTAAQDPWSQQGEPTTPVWFGQTHEMPRDHAALGLPGVAGDPTLPAAGATTAYPPLTTPPAGPPPSFPTRDGAEPAQPEEW